MILNEIVKPFLNDDEKDEFLSSIPEPTKDLLIIDDEPIYGSSFFDTDYLGLNPYGNSTIMEQNAKIDQYRMIQARPEVQEGIHEIVNEIIYTVSNESPLKVQTDLDNKKLQEAISDCFDKISGLMRLDLKLFNIVKQGYVDGQIVIHGAYGKNQKEGIQKITMLDPKGLFKDIEDGNFKYEDVDEHRRHGVRMLDKNQTYFSPEEIVRVDFGLRENNLILSYLEQVIKVSNMLQSLEDMLIPMRFSRSISRRVFNVDIGDLPPKRGQQVMNEYQKKFKYKKFYNTVTGEISNQQHITSMVEDYWFQNRSGGKGTEVDVLDESGNLGELDDILYFNKKLYKALGVPVSRQGKLGDSYDSEMDFGQTSFTREDIQFYLFISRIRKVYEELFKEILKREVISTGVMSIKEWQENEAYIKIVFSSELIYLDKIKMHLFTEKINGFRDQMDYMGKIFSQKTQIKNIFNMNEEEIIEEMQEIQKEQKDELFKHLYDTDGW